MLDPPGLILHVTTRVLITHVTESESSFRDSEDSDATQGRRKGGKTRDKARIALPRRKITYTPLTEDPPPSGINRAVAQKGGPVNAANFKAVGGVKPAVNNSVATSTPNTSIEKSIEKPLDVPAWLNTPQTCTCEAHKGIKVCDLPLDLSLAELCDAIFAEGGSKIVFEAHRRRLTGDLKFEDWEDKDGGEGRRVRKVTYKYVFKAILVGKISTPCYEEQEVFIKNDRYHKASSKGILC
ncbi:hypothetical protein HK101_006110 [Irineochytrium annulatum]|nr:hypothetical protein HK101_006110 [Irineochytrium annulatum]